ncbi:MAG TPA: Gfo/Idh/MocA family oxidoreductase [Mycobacteriales bacterium]|nr:Gfo/Idh/MocA family oxidoreductase [Mycobacteriales bacterium]
MPSSIAGMPFEKFDQVRVGMVGLGRRGSSLLSNVLHVDGAVVTGLYDPDPDQSGPAAAAVADSGQEPPAVFGSFEDLLASDQVDLVCIATPWDQHTPMAVAALDAGKHTCVEVPAATTVEECWALVDASERAGRHCIMLENCCYDYNELLVLNMVRAGMFGELLHAEAAYIHDLREHLLVGQAWRRKTHISRDGNLYPTHGLGPVAKYLGINRDDYFTTLVSMSSPHRGLEEYRAEHLPADDESWSETYRCGDINTSIIQTAQGRTILLQHQVVNPRPYDRLNLISGTKGTFRDFPARIYLEGQDGPEEYTDLEPYRERFEHELWKDHGSQARSLGGHGGADYVMFAALIGSMLRGEAPDMDVYDAAAWSVPGPLSEQSVAAGSAPVAFPDFLRRS